MSEQHPHSVHCAANGCPCQGSLTRSTSGGGEFWCGWHFEQDPHRIHEITAELRRLGWLVQLTKCIRDFLGTGVWTELHAKAYKEIALHQRGDLEMLPSSADRAPETHAQWLRRLEQVLTDATKAPPAAKPHQQPLEV